MAQRRSQAGMFPGAFGGFSRIGEQEMYDPIWTNIDFADFQGLNMNLINQNAQFAQEVANKRLDELKEAQTKMLEDIQLNKVFDYVEKDFQNKIASVIQNAGNVQLSDAANYTNLNSNLISIKNDPKLKQAVYSSEQAKKAQEMFDKDPNLKNRPWDAPMYENYQRFLRGETNDFELMPVYKDVDMVAVWDDFYKTLPKAEQDDLQKYGAYGLVQAKTEGRNVDELINKIQYFKNNIIKNNPEIKSHLDRRTNYAVKGTPPEELPARAQQWQEDYLNETINAVASKYAQVNKTLGSVSADPNESIKLGWAGEKRMQRAQDKQDELVTPYELKGGVLTKGNKVIKSGVENAALLKNVTTSLLPSGKVKIGNLEKQIIPNSLELAYANNKYYLTGQAKGATSQKNFTLEIPGDVIFNAVNSLNSAPTIGGVNTTNNTNNTSGTSW